MDEKRYKSTVVIWGVIFLVLHTLSLINVIGLNPFTYTYLEKLMTSLVALIVLALVIIYMGLSLKEKKAGPIIGIVLGAIYIMNFIFMEMFIGIINLVAGICFIISCTGMLKYINGKKNETVVKPKEDKQEENV